MCAPLVALPLLAGAGTALGAGALGATTLGALSLGATAASGAMSAVGQYQQGQVSKQIADMNANMANNAASDALYRGNLQAQNAQRQADMAAGATRARLAGNGVDLGVGTASALQGQDEFFGETNVDNTRYNAAREAWTDRTQAGQFTFQGQAAQQQGTMGAFATALGTAGQVAGRWYNMRNGGGAGMPNAGLYYGS